jgi:hypothetical protein
VTDSSPADDLSMQSYAVLWSEASGPVRAGKLELDSDGLCFEGAAARRVGYDEITGVRMGRTLSERIQGRPSILVELGSGSHMRIGSLAGPGTLHELADRLLVIVAPAAAAS